MPVCPFGLVTCLRDLLLIVLLILIKALLTFLLVFLRDCLLP
jgi:hypothetical protein